MPSRLITGGLLFILVLAIASTCRSQSESVSSQAEIQPESVSVPPTTAPSARVSTPDPQRETTSEGQIATITAQDPNAQVNVRSLPSAEGNPIGTGMVGDQVVLGRSETAADGYTWHYVTFQSDTTVGWIRSDLLDIPPLPETSNETANPSPPVETPSDVLKTALDEECGSTQAIEAYFVTQSHTIYVCKNRNHRTYLSQESGTEQVIVIAEVEALGGGYIISNDNFEYRLDSASLVVVRFDDSGQQEEVLREEVIFAERY